MPEHVFVETNFVVDWAAPAHLRVPEAITLVERAARGEIVLHLRAICLHEARPVLRSSRFQPRTDVDPIRSFLRDASVAGTLGGLQRDAAFHALDSYEAYMRSALADVPTRIESLRRSPGLDVFAADDAILERSVDLMSQVDGNLKPFDLSVLASVLVHARRVAEGGGVSFCERDADLQPWDRDGNPRRWLQRLYDDAGVWVFGDFAMTSPARPDGFG